MANATTAASTGTIRQGDAFENLSHENRKFAPSEDFAANAVVTAGGLRGGRRRPARFLGPAGP